MANFDDIYNEIKGNVKQYAETSLTKYNDEAKREVEQFLESSKETVRLWTEQLMKKEITVQEYEYLVGGLKDIAELKILKNAGLAQQRVAAFVGVVLNTIIDVVLKRIGL